MADSIPKVLVICKCPDTGPVWALSLKQRQFQVALENSLGRAVQRWVKEAPDMIVLDADNGDDVFINLIRDLRKEAACPILLLTPRKEEDYCLEAYRSGVDECIPKPVSPALFIVKANAWLRRARTIPSIFPDPFTSGKFRLDSSRRTLVIGDDSPFGLTNLEFRLMYVFMSHPDAAVSPDELIDRVWGYSGEGNRPLLKNLIYRLRRKVEKDPASPRSILTMAGGAYLFVKE
jgi:DNA-binding response OmpR family regulator